MSPQVVIVCLIVLVYVCIGAGWLIGWIMNDDQGPGYTPWFDKPLNWIDDIGDSIKLLKGKIMTTVFLAIWSLIIAFIVALITYASPACAQQMPTGKLSEQQVKELVKDDLMAHLDGAESALGWKQILTTAPRLQAAYDANEVAADKKFANGPDIFLTGIVVSIDKTIGDKAVLNLYGGTNPYVGPRTFILPGNEDWLAGLRKGNNVALVCDRVRRILANLALHDCLPKPVYVELMVTNYMRDLPKLARQGNEMAMFLQRKMK